MKYIIIIWIIFICLYHYFIQNGIEKIFNQTYFNYDSVKRPLKKCENDIYKTVECIGNGVLNIYGGLVECIEGTTTIKGSKNGPIPGLGTLEEIKSALRSFLEALS